MNLVLLGSSGQLGGWIKNAIEAYNYKCFSPDFRLDDAESLLKFCRECRASAVINAAGLNNKKCEELQSDSLEHVFNVNSHWPTDLAAKLNRCSVPFYHLSTEYVFGQENGDGPFSEAVEPLPSTVYGKSKLQGDRGVVAEHGHVIRAAMLPVPFPYAIAATNLVASKLRASEACRRIVSYVANGLSSGVRPGVLHICGVRRSIADFVKEELQDSSVEFRPLVDGVVRPLDSSLCSLHPQGDL